MNGCRGSHARGSGLPEPAAPSASFEACAGTGFCAAV